MTNPTKKKMSGTREKTGKTTIPGLKEKLEKWCFRRRVLIIVGIIIVSVIFRLVYFLELNKTHQINQHLWKETDMYVFDGWARDIAKGDLLSRSYVQAEHSWMRQVSEDYFKDHPDKLAIYKAKAAPDTSFGAVSRLLWAHWYGENAFPHEPLYSYFVALNYRLFGNDVRWVFVWQLLFGVLTNILIYLTTRRLFGDLAGLCSAVLAVFCGPMLFYELVLLRSSMACFFTILVIYLTALANEKNTVLRWLIAGISCGMAMMIHTFFILYLTGTIIILLFIHRKKLSRIGATAGGFVLGFFLVISPVMIRNSIMGVKLMTMSNASAVSFISMNDKSFPGCYSGWGMNITSVSKIFGETDGSVFKTIILTLKTHPSLGSYLALEWGKLQASFSWFEIPNNVNFYFYREQAPVLFVTFVSFLVIAPLALAGIILALLKRINAWPLYLMFLVMMFPLLVFMVLSRYRIPIAAVLIPFASWTISEFFTPWKGKRNGLLLLGTGILAYWCYLPRDENSVRISRLDYEEVYLVHYSDSLQADNNRKDWKKFIIRLDDYIQRYQPSGLLEIQDYYKCKDEKESDIFSFFSFIHHVRSQVLFFGRDSTSAVKENQIALKLKNATR